MISTCLAHTELLECPDVGFAERLETICSVDGRTGKAVLDSDAVILIKAGLFSVFKYENLWDGTNGGAAHLS